MLSLVGKGPIFFLDCKSPAKPIKGADVSKAKNSGPATMERREKKERRQPTDRRSQQVPVAIERRKLHRREKVNRRRQIDPTTCERDYSLDEIEFMHALDRYKRASGRMFPTCSEILEVVRSLGYVKSNVAGAIPCEPLVEQSVSGHSTSEFPPEVDG
jgi:hypothetical protein